jgi:hypothetical protein
MNPATLVALPRRRKKRAVDRPTVTKTEKRQEAAGARDRYTSLIESLVQEEIRQRERAVLSEWQIELSALQASRS